MDDFSFLTSPPTDPLAFLDPADPAPPGEPSTTSGVLVPEEIDELALAQLGLEAARSAAAALEAELDLLWIKNPSDPDEARGGVKYLDDQVAALEGNPQREFVVLHKENRAVLLENIKEYELIEHVYIEKRAHYFLLKGKVDQLLKIRESDASMAKKRADDYAKLYP
ncbi:hypothetical protein [Rhodoferax sp.]|uniref:hypothetical protein n=1 Tax=Rhodoferax sp. TaxID=50421 RepID=UPI0027546050|nr:hypothetical protein [Rhodoferax sp.]